MTTGFLLISGTAFNTDLKILLDVFWKSLKSFDRERGMVKNLYGTDNRNSFVSRHVDRDVLTAYCTPSDDRQLKPGDQHPLTTKEEFVLLNNNPHF